MVGLAEGWESDYDGKRWFYRYKATGTVQYHFPQPGDEFAEYFLDSGAGPLQLTPEESLAVEQAKRTSPSISDSSTRGTKTNGRKNTEADEEHGMSATGYFDPSSFEYFPGVHKDAGPTTSDGRNTPGDGAEASYAAESSPYPPVRNPNQTEKAPSAGQQTWSPVGHVAELATMETVKCAEELAPVELDSTSVAMPSIHTDISQQSAELSTHRIPAKKTPDPEPTRPVMEPVDSYPLTSASFVYPPLKENVQHGNEASSSSASRIDDTAFQNASQQSTAGTQTSSEEVNVVVAHHEGSHVSSTLTPGGGQSNHNLQETQEPPNPKPPHQFIPNAQGSVSSHHLHKTEVQVPHRHHSQPSVSTMKVSSDGLVSAMPSPPTANGSPGFLLFHEIPTASNLSLDSTAIHTNRLPSRPTQASHDSDHGRTSPQAPPVSVDLAMSKPQDLSHAATRPQSAAPKSSLQQAAARPPMGYQGSVPGPTQPPQQSPYQHPAALAQSVSPLPSQVSSPATSIASLHISQSSTPSNPSANMSAPMSSNSRPNSSIHQMPNAPLRPSSIAPLQGVNQQTGNNSRPQSNSTPTSRPPAGMAQARPSSMASSPASLPASLPAKPFPMLPGQVTPLPSQVGSNPIPLPMPQPASNNHIKPPGNMQSAGAGQHPAQATSVGMAQHHVSGGHVNPTQNSQNSSQGNVSYGTSQGPMKPSQPQPQPQPQPQSSSIPPGANQIGRPQQAAKPPQQQTGSYHQQQAVYGQPPMSQQPVVSPPTSKPPVVVQNTFPPPPVGPAPSPVQLQSITSGQATAVIADAGKGMKKLAKKLFQSPAIKQTTAVIGGAVMAETMGINPMAGAQLANSIYANSQRPPLTHAQTAPVQTFSPQQQTFQQSQPARPQQQLQQLYQPGCSPGNPQPGRPQLGNTQGNPQGNPQSGQIRPNQPQQGHPHPHMGNPQTGTPQPGIPQPGRPQSGNPQPGHPQGNLQLGQPRPNQPQPGRPPQGTPQGNPQLGQPRPNQPQSANPQPVQGRPPQAQPQPQPVGAQAGSRPPGAYHPGKGPQFQAQVALNQQQQYPLMRPNVMGNRPPPPPMGMAGPGFQPQAQINAEANMAAAIVGSAVGAAFHQQQGPGPGQGQDQGNVQGYFQPEHSFNSQSDGIVNHENPSENPAGGHEQAYDSYIPPPPPPPPPPPLPEGYMDNSYMANNMPQTDDSNYFTNNNHEETANNTADIDNSNYSMSSNTEVVDDSTIGATDEWAYSNVVDTTTTTTTSSYTEADVTMNMNVDVNMTIYTDGNEATSGMDENTNAVSSGDFGGDDYSGDAWSGFEF